MKKLLLTLLLASMASLSFSQIEKGKTLIGASTAFGLGNNSSNPMTLSFVKSKTKYPNGGSQYDNSYINISLSPRIGFMMSEQLAGGLDILFSNNRNEYKVNSYQGNDIGTSLGAGPFLRYFFGGKKALPFLEAGGILATNWEKRGGTGVDFKYNNSFTNYRGGLGVAILLGPKSTLDLLAAYNSTRFKNNYPNQSSTTTTNSVSIQFGFTMFLGKNGE